MQNIPSFNGLSKKTNKQQAIDSVDDKKSTPPIDASYENENQKASLLLDNPINQIFNKKNIKIAAIAALSATLAFSVGRGQYNKLRKELNDLKNSYDLSHLQETLQKLRKAEDSVEELSSKNSEHEKSIEKLKALIKKLEEKLKKEDINLPEDKKEAVDLLAKKYQEIIDGTTSIYEDALAPKGEKPFKLSFKKIYEFRDSKFTTGKAKSNNFVDSLLNKLNIGEDINIPVVSRNLANEDIQDACIKSSSVEDLGKALKTSITTNYGKKVQWSNEKIARDILQNFYDGNDHTLDGVGFSIKKIGDKYRIRIDGASVFDHEKLLLLGNSSKVSDPYDAGGFGEGAKVVIANLLSKDSVKTIKYGSADWELVFGSNKEGIITSTLNKKTNILNGNYIEFDTSDENIAQSIIRATDYFRHSKNSDFIAPTFENDNFAFRILKPKEKGSFYLTQRFEYKDDGAWEGNVEGLDIIFKRRPDEKRYQEIAGKQLNFGRDRNKMNEKDIYQLSRVFLKDLKDEDLIESLLATRPHWIDFRANQNSAIKNFVRALCDEMGDRSLGFNFDKEKLCLAYNEKDVVLDFVRGAGYRLISGYNTDLEKIGLPQATEIFKSLSVHNALKPTVAETKKLKVLEEAIAVIQEALQKTYHTKLREIVEKVTPEDIKFSCVGFDMQNLLQNLPDFEFSKEAIECTGKYGYYNILDENKCAQELYDYLKRKIGNISSSTLDLDENQAAIKLLVQLLEHNERNNEILSQYLTQLKNLAIIEQKDVKMPRFIFDRTKEVCKNTLGEAIIDGSFFTKTYKGHWVDRNYLNHGGFFELLATWVHEICHKSGGDGTPEFTYKLTDIIESLLDATTKSSDYQSKLLALEKVFNEIQ